MDADTARASQSQGRSDRTLDAASKRAAVSRGGGGRMPAPAAASGRVNRLTSRIKNSVWAPVLVKAATVFAGMLALAAVGAASTLRGPGVPVEASQHADATRATIGGVWLATAPSGAAPGKTEPPSRDPGAAGDANGKKPPATPASPSANAAKGITDDGKVILNFATAEELTRLPGVGQKRAEAILALRQRLGRFRRPTDLLRVRGIGPKSLQRMLPHLVVDAPNPESGGK